MSAVAEGTVAPQGGAEDEGKPDTAKGTSTQNGESKAAGSARPNLSTRTTRRVAAEATGDEALSHLPEEVIKEVKALRKRRQAIEDGKLLLFERDIASLPVTFVTLVHAIRTIHSLTD